MFIDTHTHLYSSQFDEDREEVIQRSIDNGVDKLLLPNIDRSSIQGMLDLQHKFPGHCYAMMGLHPCYVDTSMEKELQVVQEWLETTPFAAIGEVGLDFYHSIEFKDLQVEAFGRQIEMATTFDLPLVIHSL